MSPEQISSYTQLLAAAGSVVAPLIAAYVATLRYRLKLALIAAGRDPSKVPDIAGAGPLLLMLLAGASLLVAVGAPQRIAHFVVPIDDEVAGAAGDSCTKDSDCGSGCSCGSSGQCRCSARKPRPAPPPRRLASMEETLCADCQALPWHTPSISAFPIRRRDD